MSVIKLFDRGVAVGDILCLDSNNKKVWKRPSEVVSDGLSGYTTVGVCFHRDNAIAKIINKDAQSLAYRNANVTPVGRESSVYKKKTGDVTNFRGMLNIARSVYYWGDHPNNTPPGYGRIPNADESITHGGNVSSPDNLTPVNRSSFETSAYCKLLRQTYDSYETYISENFGIKYPQSFGCFELPDGKSYTYPALTGTALTDFYTNHPAFNYCKNLSYSVDGIAAGDWWLPGVKEGVELMKDETLRKVAQSMFLINGWGKGSNIETTITNYNSSHRWFAQRYYGTSAWYFDGHNGILGYNGCTGALAVQAVTSLNVR